MKKQRHRDGITHPAFSSYEITELEKELRTTESKVSPQGHSTVLPLSSIQHIGFHSQRIGHHWIWHIWNIFQMHPTPVCYHVSLGFTKEPFKQSPFFCFSFFSHIIQIIISKIQGQYSDFLSVPKTWPIFLVCQTRACTHWAQLE